MWDQPDFPSSLLYLDTAFFDFERDISSSQIAENSEVRFFRYLPLYNGKEYIKGLTVYLSVAGIVRLEAHFAISSRFSGCRSGYALYFPLYPKERIAYSWLRVINSPVFVIPTLTVGSIHSTSSAVANTFFLGSNDIRTDALFWTLHSTKPCCGKPLQVDSAEARGIYLRFLLRKFNLAYKN